MPKEAVQKRVNSYFNKEEQFIFQKMILDTFSIDKNLKTTYCKYYGYLCLI